MSIHASAVVLRQAELFAGQRAFRELVERSLVSCPVPPAQQARLFRLLGASLETADPELGLRCWRRAHQFRPGPDSRRRIDLLEQIVAALADLKTRPGET
jgi:hypothetical protein